MFAEFQEAEHVPGAILDVDEKREEVRVEHV